MVITLPNKLCVIVCSCLFPFLGCAKVGSTNVYFSFAFHLLMTEYFLALA